MDIDDFRKSLEDAAAIMRDVHAVMPGLTTEEFLALSDTLLDAKNIIALRLLRNSVKKPGA